MTIKRTDGLWLLPGDTCRGIVCSRLPLAVLDVVSYRIWSRIGLPRIIINNIIHRSQRDTTPGS